MAEDTTYVGLDAHLKRIVVAMLSPGASGPFECHLPQRADRPAPEHSRPESSPSPTTSSTKAATSVTQ